MTALFGLRVKLDDNGHSCCNGIAVVSRSNAPHAGELRCATCNRHRGFVSHEFARWLENVISKFGAPRTPIVVRYRDPQPADKPPAPPAP